MKRLAIILLLVSLSSASLIWQTSTNGAVTARPIIMGGMLIVPSDDGYLYGLDPGSGATLWKEPVGMTPNEVVAFGNEAVVSASDGSVTAFDQNGKQIWSVDLNSTAYNASYVYGASANAKEVFVSADDGIYSISDDGTVSVLTTFPSSLVTAPAAGPDYVVYGINNTLIEMSHSGATLWNASIDGGSFYPPAAIDSDGTVYAGALDGMMHAYASNGVRLWQVMTRNWVMSTPLVYGGMVYFGSNDGGVYAVDAGTGNIVWQAQTQLAVQSEPESGTMGGRNVIFVGSSDNSIYAIDVSNGEIVWKGSADGGVGSPLFYQNPSNQNLVIFGSEDGTIYAYSTQRACSITNPPDGSYLGNKEVVVEGKYVSAAGGASVWVKVGNQDWQQANTSNDDWVYYINPSVSFNSGLNTLACRVIDAGGAESGDIYSNVSITYDPTIPLSNLVVTASPDAMENTPFTIYVNDGDDGSPVDRFSLTAEGQEYSGDGSVNLTLPAGTYSVTVQKIGFNNATVDVSVGSTGLNPFYIVIGVVLILIILWQVWPSLSRARSRKA
jgi:outer membrane protein assembly factor BamB